MTSKTLIMILLGVLPVPGTVRLLLDGRVMIACLLVVILYAMFFMAILPAVKTGRLVLKQGSYDLKGNPFGYWFNLSVIVGAFCLFSIVSAFSVLR
ncbi:MAG: hypothetical protein V1809_10535 [Planctomycetota bacterium]